jgi:LPXTG-motif cell wall-anchored protein
VVTVTGTPTDPNGNPIGPDVSDDDEAVVEVIDELPATGIAPIWMALAALLAAAGALILVANRRRMRSQ